MAIRIPSASGIKAWLEPAIDLERLGAAWRALEAQSEASFFQSWGWIGCWLRHLGPDRQPLAAIAERQGEVVGLGVFVPGRARRFGIVRARTLRLHENGDPALDPLFVEHNGLVAESADLPQVWTAVVAVLAGSGFWDELVLGGLGPRAAGACIAAARAQRLEVVVGQRRAGAYLDLEGLRRSGRAFADGLSRNTRHQLVRARRLYEARGPLCLRSAETVEEALAMLDRLKAWHQRTWRRRGQPGCFATPAFESFHRELIRERFGDGEIRLACAAAGDRPFGYLYNFARGGRIYAYQSGFDYARDGRLKPGLLSHALAIEQALRDGFATYDFMAGENRLKASFASHREDMTWLSVRRPSALSWLERGLAALGAPARRAALHR
jgi:CelD/BcsL family acetyltransferase involved in cellulose biosynthesis